MTKGIFVVGSLNVDSVVTVERFARAGETVTGRQHATYPGGKGANQAFAAARMGLGVSGAPRVRMLGRVGHDAHADGLLQQLTDGGVDVSGVQRDATTTSGIAIITIDGSGENQIVVVPGANGTFRPEHLDSLEKTLQGADLVLLQLEIPMDTVVAAARIAHAAGARVILDPAPASPVSDALLALCEFVTPNETELQVLLGTSDEPTRRSLEAIEADAKSLVARGARNVIVKLGDRGAVCVGAGSHHRWPAFAVHAVDTTAAGDTWNGAFAAALALGSSVAEAGTMACAAAAISVTRKGAQPGMPTRDEVAALMAQT